MNVDIPGCTSGASVAEAAVAGLLELKGVGLDSLANTVLALDGVTRNIVSVCPGLGLLDAGDPCYFCQSFRLRKPSRCGSTCGGAAAALNCGLSVRHAVSFHVCRCVSTKARVRRLGVR